MGWWLKKTQIYFLIILETGSSKLGASRCGTWWEPFASHYALPWQRKRELWCHFLLNKDANPIMGAPPSWPHLRLPMVSSLNVIATEGSGFNIWILWGKRFNPLHGACEEVYIIYGKAQSLGMYKLKCAIKKPVVLHVYIQFPTSSRTGMVCVLVEK